MKIQVNNKPLNPQEKGKSMRNKRLNDKFNSLQDLMEYVEELEKRVIKLENRKD